MRNCGNCYNGHFQMNDKGVELYCDINEFCEEEVSRDFCCEYHRFGLIDPLEENYLLYDESYLGPGFFIVTKEDDQVTKWLKIYIANSDGFPNYAIRAYSVDRISNPGDEFSKINFTFRDIEDFENGLYRAFTDLCHRLDGGLIATIDRNNQGRNHLSLNTNGNVTTLTISKDVYKTKETSGFVDINLGNDLNYSNYRTIIPFYNDLFRAKIIPAREEEIKQLIKKKQ